MIMLFCSWLLQGAHAQESLDNSSFEDPGWSPWVPTTAGASYTVALVNEGDDLSAVIDTTSIDFPDGEQAAMIRSGTMSTTGGGFIDYPEFTVTHTQLSYSFFEDTVERAAVAAYFFDGPPLDWETEQVLGADAPRGAHDAFSEHLIDVSELCGQAVRLQLGTNHFRVSRPAIALFDDVHAAGPVCPEFTDEDADGFCLTGADLDGDGDCASADEILVAPADCDDADPDSYPMAPEVPGDGIDQDCAGGDLPGPRSATGAIFLGAGHADLGTAVDHAAGATVSLWYDGGDDLATGADDHLAFVTSTDASGDYRFDGLADNQRYWLVVHADTVRPPLGANADEEVLWPEQSWAPAGALCDTASPTVAAGPCLGGRNVTVSDDPSSLTTAEHVAAIDLNGSDLTDVDVGFSTGLVLHASDIDANPTARWGQGSFRQAILNLNASASDSTLRFVPATSPTHGDSIGEWWEIELAAPLPPVGPGVTVDGRAWCNGADCALADLRDTHPGVLDAPDTVGLGVDGEAGTGDESSLAGWEIPELALRGSSPTTPWPVTGGGLENLVLLDLPIEVMGTGSSTRDLISGRHHDTEEGATEIALSVRGAREATVSHNWLVGTDVALRTEGALADVYVSNNAIQPAPEPSSPIGIQWAGSTLPTSMGDTIEGNLITGMARGVEVSTEGQTIGLSIQGNTITDCGVADGQPAVGGAGLLATQLTDDSTVTASDNLVTETTGPGIAAAGPGQLVLDGNVITGSAGLAVDLAAVDLDPDLHGAGDGVSGNDGQPGDGIAGHDYPVIDWAQIDMFGDLHLAGIVGTRASMADTATEVALFAADDDGDNLGEVERGDGATVAHGEPARFVADCTVDDGSFECTVATAGLVDGDAIVGIARHDTAGGPTSSELGPNTHVVDLGLLDTDGDGLTDADEAQLHDTDPWAVDTDGDGLTDAAEIDDYLTDPVDADTDQDGLEDGLESIVGTDPLASDTDTDGLLDSEELDLGSDPTASDTDGDGLADGEEASTGTDPLDADTDRDGLSDAEEVDVFETDPAVADTDDDGLSDGIEVLMELDPTSPDSDLDGLEDGDELSLGTDPLQDDTDGGGLDDGVEIAEGLDPLNPYDDDLDEDPDSDGLTNGEEDEHRTDRYDADTDGDGLDDGVEVLVLGTEPTRADTDGGGVADGDEVTNGTDPLDPADDVVGSGTSDSGMSDSGTQPTQGVEGGDSTPDGSTADDTAPEGCGCRPAALSPTSGTGWLVVLGLGLAHARRRRAQRG